MKTKLLTPISTAAAAGLLVLGSAMARAEDYAAKITTTPGAYTSMSVQGAGDHGMMTGTALIGGQPHAATQTEIGFRDLHPLTGFTATRILNSWGGTYHVGSGESSGVTQALFWVGGGPAVSLHPAGAQFSTALGVDGQWQSGRFRMPGQTDAACLWNRTASSLRVLPQTGYSQTTANGVDATDVPAGKLWAVGSGLLGGSRRALLWTHFDQSPTDLQPAGYSESEALGCDYPQAAGWLSGPQTGGKSQAALWKAGEPAPVILHPGQIFSESMAVAVRDGIQVGFGRPLNQPNRMQAILWHGTSNWTNLHARLPLAYQYWSSRATDIDNMGNIVGFVTDGNAVSYPVIWERLNSTVQIGSLATLSDRFGVNTWSAEYGFPGPDLNSRLNAIKPLKPRFARLSFRPDFLGGWNDSTKTMTYWEPRWNEALIEVDKLFRAGLVPIIVLHSFHAEMPDSLFGLDEPRWPWNVGWATETQTQNALAAMAARLAQRIARRNPNSDFFIEVGNELNKNPEWPAKRDLYANLLFKVADAVEPVAPRAIVMPTAFTFLESWALPDPPAEQLPVNCMTWLSGKPGYAKLKAVTLHVYNSKEDRADENGFVNLGRAAPPEDLLRHLREIRTIAGSKLLVVSETGKSLLYNPEEPQPEENSPGNFNQRSQSNYLLRYLLTCLEGGADIITVYELCDRTLGLNDEEKKFGLLDGSLQIRTSGSAVLDLFNRIGRSTPVQWKRQTEVLSNQEPQEHRFLYEYKFLNPNGTTSWVRWTDRIHYGVWWPENTDFPRRPTVYGNSLLP